MIKSIYVDNYKGFEKQFFTFNKVNFFVGENSSGKSSIIELIDTLINNKFVDFSNTTWHNKEFNNLVSRCQNERHTSFSVAMEIENSFPKFTKDSENNVIEVKDQKEAVYYYFKITGSKQGYPILKRGYQWISSEKNIAAFNITKSGDTTFSVKRKVHLESFAEFVKLNLNFGFRKKTRRMFSTAKMPFEYLFFEATEDFISSNDQLNTKLFSPIRSLPKPIYNRMRENKYSPSGEHIANSLATEFKTRKNLMNRINQFGSKSGLFDNLEINNITNSKSSPFTIDVTIDGITTSIDQVGTGVGQVLPIVTEMISLKGAGVFLIQQPELHLHPKAQAEFGSFLFEEININNELMAICETHSEYLIDSFRRKVAVTRDSIGTIYYFTGKNSRKNVSIININNEGKYTGDSVLMFRQFYLDESLKNINI